ncbi:Mu transposase C-terminal domain-containing protein [Sphingobium baderi]|uniref:Mu transposase C-terminal domain-containing protein n=1 Tax=Sphingobium baderi TaxID=1332080 RepID=UPI002B4100EB|nr:Mu transposase C-terminal domain-containing protein [Sphingobium baderi]WRD75687.1 Mu transposase C-terminal domain-containing protein [Sphingobium baderi]WRD76508.1 Mu transposase C-terminal domain-containing protein [Sphingobium baderi]WRD77091.1 Mu transposase C-terminal domain-containing protein [Sphingobium baderi]WRD78610.1 Mu transposase C-terminal domain-containing protein [Sphingobium baderi]WRD78717.1 Mu transposase C-terminal domain-containing protein [Sphingobium baderi]
MTRPHLLDVNNDAWAEARRCLPVVRRLATKTDRTRADVEAAARALGYGPTHLYNLLRRYLGDPRLTSLLPRTRGPAPGGALLDPAVDAVIEEVIDSFYLSRQQPLIADLVRAVHERCHQAGLRVPGRNTIARRVQKRPAAKVLAERRGRKAARDRYGAVTASLIAEYPLSLIQIDHTLVDVIVVDAETREPIQRPWLTLAIDVATRCVAGFHLSLEPPSATSVALCISHAALMKEGWLAARSIENEWPVYGIPERLHLDNAKEFRSEALKRGCQEYGIDIDYRPVRTPHYGGHIERLIGTMMGKVHLLPGTTFSDIRVKGDLNPEKTAVMTIDEVERWLAHAIAGVYHRSLHRGIGMPPLAAWTRGIVGDDKMLGRGAPTMVPDPRRFLIDFLPIATRRVRREGISLHSIHYWADVLRTWIGHPEPMIVRYDPRDLSRIYLLGEDNHYYDVSYRDLGRPPISLWEHRLALKRLREEGRALVDEAAIFRTIAAMRRIADDAVLASKTARRQRARRLRVVEGGRVDNVRSAQPPKADDQTKVEPFNLDDIYPFEEWS